MIQVFKSRNTNSIAVIGNYLPRRCGIATFTTDICNALSEEMADKGQVIALSMDDIQSGYNYPDRVKFQLRENQQSDYLRAADFLNINHVDIAILQHEYGIFGGKEGTHIFHLLKKLKMPCIAHLHTILSEPSKEQRNVIIKLAKYCARLVVMTQKALELLTDVYGIREEMIAIIPHGIPDVPFVDSYFYKDKFKVENRTVILTFGLLGPTKGIETVIEALPEIVKAHPDVIYLILGATHPAIIRNVGEEYRIQLQNRIKKLGLENHVEFYNQFVDLQSLTQFIMSADIYITPYLSKEQITSGTLSYAMGMGKAIISTPYWHAQELLDNGRGILVPFQDAKAISKEAIKLLSDDRLRNSMRKKAYQFCRPMIWKEVARSYLTLTEDILDHRASQARPHDLYPGHSKTLDELPEINLKHLNMLTDDTGMLQHGFHSIANRNHGYCIDDNARALITCCMHYELRQDESIIPLIQTYLAFIYHAFNKEKQRFRNFLSFDRKWLEEMGSEDSHARTIWSLGIAVKMAPNESIRNLACSLFSDSLKHLEEFTSPRAWAFSIIGFGNYLRVFSGDASVRRMHVILAKKMQHLYNNNANKDWLWWEDVLSYANARLPHAMIVAGAHIQDKDMLEIGLTSLEWLLDLQTADDGYISVVGNENWYSKGKERSLFDQQPIEIMTLIEACREAWQVTHEKKWLQQAEICFDWFLGNNDLNEQVYDFRSGGCYDGLQPHGLNQNMGAESTLAWLISLLHMYEMHNHEMIFKDQDSQTISSTALP